MEFIPGPITEIVMDDIAFIFAYISDAERSGVSLERLLDLVPELKEAKHIMRISEILEKKAAIVEKKNSDTELSPQTETTESSAPTASQESPVIKQSEPGGDDTVTFTISKRARNRRKRRNAKNSKGNS
jgi:hypothetical protein